MFLQHRVSSTAQYRQGQHYVIPAIQIDCVIALSQVHTRAALL